MEVFGCFFPRTSRLRGNKSGKPGIIGLNIRNVPHISFCVFFRWGTCLADGLYGPDTLT